MTDDKIKEPTIHQKRLAKLMRKLADALDCGEIKQTAVIVHYGQLAVQPDHVAGDFQVTRKSTGKRLISMALVYDTDVPSDLLTEITKQEGLT